MYRDQGSKYETTQNLTAVVCDQNIVTMRVFNVIRYLYMDDLTSLSAGSRHMMPDIETVAFKEAIFGCNGDCDKPISKERLSNINQLGLTIDYALFRYA